MTFEELFHRIPNRKLMHFKPPERMVSLDPGETTGACVFHGLKLAHAEQLPTGDMTHAPRVMNDFLNKWKPQLLIMEDYRVYQWKARSHTWNSLHTPRLIGFIEGWCHLQTPAVPLIKQTAQQGKGFCTDDKLKEWGFYLPGERHSRDAIRHGCYYLLFPSLPSMKVT
jgi:hypothetical protein